MIYTFKSHIMGRRNKVDRWFNTDDEKNFLSLPAGTTRYRAEDVEYRFNSLGFRCDELTETAEFPVIFIGCSHTEGIGTALKDVWAHLLLLKIREATGAKIPYWNLGVYGGSIDLMAETLYWISKDTPIVPKLVIALFPCVFRRIASFDRSIPASWCPTGHLESSSELEVLLDTKFARFQSRRSLMIIEQTRFAWNIPLVASTWSIEDKNIFRSFPNFTIVDFPEDEELLRNRARDGAHFGPEMHAAIADNYWSAIEPLL